VLENLAREGVDVTAARRRAGVGPSRSTIVIGREDGTRTVFSDRNGFEGPDADWPAADVIRGTRVLLVDHVGVAAMIRAARIARDAGVPVVGDFERAPGPEFPTLLELTDHLIVGRTFAAHLTGEDDPARAARALWHAGRVAVVTCGASGCWAADAPGAARPIPAPAVAVADTTGCGDVFHGAYAAALARGAGLDERLRRATAAAAFKAAHARPPRASELDDP
jgi:sugar/nucleoside kinase (ribokinase family)